MKTLGNRTLQSAATVFLGTYAKSDGLGKLGLIEEASASGAYTVKQPQTPPVWVLACALHDYWQAFGEGCSELLLKDLGRQDGFAGLFFLGPGMLGTLLSDLQSAGALNIKRDAPPYVVTKLWDDGKKLMEHLYA